MYYCGSKKELLRRGFKKDQYYNDFEYCSNDYLRIKDENQIELDGFDIPDIILELYDAGLIKKGTDTKAYEKKQFEIEMRYEKDVFVIQFYNDKFYKKKFQLKTFYYKNHEFFMWGTTKNGYVIGDVLTGCILDYEIKHINTLYHLKEGNPLDKHLQSILLNAETYRSEIYRLKQAEII